ncbi:cytochrome P450 [Frankia tisae]|uniref:cytochrome P450 n=1 Tax=Frankia tisae TaxID=2950104 RepID=UPI0021C1D8C2|nr:cytochrome P450 [Frankia tisae]
MQAAEAALPGLVRHHRSPYRVTAGRVAGQGQEVPAQARQVSDQVFLPVTHLSARCDDHSPTGHREARHRDESGGNVTTNPPEKPDVLSEEFAQDPHKYYKIMRDHYPVLHDEASGYYFVTRYNDVARIYKDSVAFSNENYAFQMEPVIGKTLIQMSGREHAVNRHLVTPALRGNYLQELLPQVDELAKEMIDEFRHSSQIDLIEKFTKWFPINVIVKMLDLPHDDLPKFHDWYSSLMAFLANLTNDPEVHAWGMRTQRDYPAYILPIIAERRRNPGTDLISRLTQAEIEGEQFSDEQIKALIGLLLIAGGETTDKAIASTLKYLIQHPEQLAAVRADPTLATQALVETLRYHPPVQIILRTATEDIDVSGTAIPKGSVVACVNGAANRDERRFNDPDKFDIFREDVNMNQAFVGSADHIAFALGRHFCVGSLLAKREAETAINQLLQAMPDIRFAGGKEPVDAGMFTRGPERLDVEFTPVTQ